jgi:CheY-like chemotaxis protein
MTHRIMIVEDEYWTAMDLAVGLQERGALVTGPFSSIPEAIEALNGAERPDAAILDIRLRHSDIFPLADLLIKDDIPFVFATGYLKCDLPTRFAESPYLEKPFSSGTCVDSVLALAEAHSFARNSSRRCRSLPREEKRLF